jgi:phage-related minor tail protein
MEAKKTPVEIAIENVETIYEATKSQRQILIDKLMGVLETMQITPGDEPATVTEQKLGLVSSLDSLLKSTEANATNLAKLQMQKKDTDSSDTARQAVVEMLKQINIQALGTANARTVVPSNLDATIDKAVEKTDHPINDTELEISSEKE